MRSKDAASCSFASSNIGVTERPDGTGSSIDLQRTNHETVALGGLIRESRVDSVTGVPLFSDTQSRLHRRAPFHAIPLEVHLEASDYGKTDQSRIHHQTKVGLIIRLKSDHSPTLVWSVS